jgi:3-phenylpropionate/trans-cinnamate dioxygenase ferredoxin reductase subunit
MLGQRVPYNDVHWFWSDQYDVNLQYAGYHTSAEQMIVRGSMTSDSFLACYMNGGRIDAALALNRGKDLRRVMPLIKARRAVTPEDLQDETVDLRSLAAA